MPNLTNHIANFTFAADLSQLAEVRNFVEIQSKSVGFDEKTIYNITLSVDEACSNLIRHSLTPDCKIALRVLRFPDRITIEISDTGHPFNPINYSEPDMKAYFNKFTRGGLGIHIIKSLMDEISYSSSAGVNTLSLIKYYVPTKCTP